jgi:homoserine kinase
MKGSAFAPATLSNLGPGFDVLGLALDQPRESIEVELGVGSGGIAIRAEGPYGDRLPLDPKKNVASFAVEKILELHGRPAHASLRIHKMVPPGSGLGSSAASSVAAAVATLRALGAPLDPDAILDVGRRAEALAAGSPHLDNVAPALFGGFVAVVGTDPPVVRSLPIPKTWALAVILPHLEVRTKDARAVLPEKVPMADAIANLRNLSGLIDAAIRADLASFSRHLVDRLAVPYRLPLWPYLEDARRAAIGAGALALEISGSGPAMFAPCANMEEAEAVGSAVEKSLRARNLGSTRYACRPGGPGALHS